MKICFVLIFVAFAFSACSLHYGEQPESVEERVPELTFSDAKFTRYENRIRTMNFTAVQIEQYTGGTKTFAKDVTFAIYDDVGNAETSGSCGLLSADTDTGKYELFENIQITNTEREVTLYANALRWDENTEQLIGSSTDTITLTKNDTTIHGTGFSASAISNSFSFAENVSGVTITSDGGKN